MFQGGKIEWALIGFDESRAINIRSSYVYSNNAVNISKTDIRSYINDIINIQYVNIFS